MAKLAQREFEILDLAGQRYLEWRYDVISHLKANGLEKTIMEKAQTTPQQKAKALVFLRHHIHESLKTEYLFLDDPLKLWDDLKERFGHLKNVILPQAKREWDNLRFQDFKSISDYRNSMYKITTRLRLCDQEITQEEMLEKKHTPLCIHLT